MLWFLKKKTNSKVSEHVLFIKVKQCVVMSFSSQSPDPLLTFCKPLCLSRSGVEP